MVVTTQLLVVGAAVGAAVGRADGRLAFPLPLPLPLPPPLLLVGRPPPCPFQGQLLPCPLLPCPFPWPFAPRCGVAGVVLRKDRRKSVRSHTPAPQNKQKTYQQWSPQATWCTACRCGCVGYQQEDEEEDAPPIGHPDEGAAHAAGWHHRWAASISADRHGLSDGVGWNVGFKSEIDHGRGGSRCAAAVYVCAWLPHMVPSGHGGQKVMLDSSRAASAV